MKSSNTGGGGSEGRHNSAGFEFGGDPVELIKFVVEGSKVSHGIDEVDVTILIVILFELFSLHYHFLPVDKDFVIKFELVLI